MASNDQGLIHNMKQTIEYQIALGKKRETLLEAICHNVKYMAKLNEKNAAELRMNRG